MAWAEEEKEDEGPGMAVMNYRILEGDPNGSVDAKTQREVWRAFCHSPLGLGKSATFGKTSHRPIPGKRYYQVLTEQLHGAMCELTIHKHTDKHVRADIRFEFSAPVDSQSEEFIVTSGDCVSVAGTFSVDKLHRIWLRPEKNGQAMWADVCFEVSRLEPTEEEMAPPPVRRKWLLPLPSAYYDQDDVQYFTPGKEFKLSREAAYEAEKRTVKP